MSILSSTGNSKYEDIFEDIQAAGVELSGTDSQWISRNKDTWGRDGIQTLGLSLPEKVHWSRP